MTTLDSRFENLRCSSHKAFGARVSQCQEVKLKGSLRAGTTLCVKSTKAKGKLVKNLKVVKRTVKCKGLRVNSTEQSGNILWF